MAESNCSCTLSVEDFNVKFEVKITRFATYPTEEPTSYVVGYLVSSKTNSFSRYFETTVEFTNTHLPASYTDSDVDHVAWCKLIPQISEWAHTVMSKSSLLGTVKVPVTLDPGAPIPSSEPVPASMPIS